FHTFFSTWFVADGPSEPKPPPRARKSLLLFNAEFLKQSGHGIGKIFFCQQPGCTIEGWLGGAQRSLVCGRGRASQKGTAFGWSEKGESILSSGMRSVLRSAIS